MPVDLSAEALLARRELAERATPGPWKKMFETAVGTDNGHQVPLRIASTNFESDAAHITVNAPDVLASTIDELLRLREEKERLEVELVGAIEVMECLLAGKPGGVYFQKYQGGLQIALRSAQLALSVNRP